MGGPDPDSLEFKQSVLRAIVRGAPVAYCILDASFRVVFLNDYFLRYRKTTREAHLGVRCYDSTNGGVPCPRCAVRDAMESGRPAKMLRKDVLRDGSVTYSDELAVPIKDPAAGGPGYVLEILIDRTEEMLLRERSNAIILEMIDSLVGLLGEKDSYTSQHSRNVSVISAKFARYMGLDPHAVFNATLGGLLHDLGKLYIPDSVLNKPGKLTDAEFAAIKEHPVFAWMLLTGLSMLRPISEVAIAHHEDWDGGGYPSGTAGEDIPIGARITAIADAYDAMTSDRPYRPALPHAEAMAEIKKSAGRDFDPALAEKFIQMVDEWGFDRESLVAPLSDPGGRVAEDFSLHWAAEAAEAAEGAEGAGSAEPGGPDDLDALLASEAFTDAALNHTPAFYSVVDEDYNLLYVSENYAGLMGRPRRELTSGKCYKMVGKSWPCYMEGGGCPATRAFRTGERQYSLISEEFGGERLYFDDYAIPAELGGPGGEKTKCCVEILFDRTAEKRVRLAFEKDIRSLMEKLRDMAAEVLPKDSANIGEIMSGTEIFIAYLDEAASSIAGR